MSIPFADKGHRDLTAWKDRQLLWSNALGRGSCDVDSKCETHGGIFSLGLSVWCSSFIIGHMMSYVSHTSQYGTLIIWRAVVRSDILLSCLEGNTNSPTKELEMEMSKGGMPKDGHRDLPVKTISRCCFQLVVDLQDLPNFLLDLDRRLNLNSREADCLIPFAAASPWKDLGEELYKSRAQWTQYQCSSIHRFTVQNYNVRPPR